MKTQHSTLEDLREPRDALADFASGNADQPLQGAATRDAFTALARLLARQAAAEAVQAAVALAASETGTAT
jgi:hypothetical protein